MIEQITLDTPLDLAIIGGKGAGLVRLLRAGLPVPEAYVIPVATARFEQERVACLTTELPAWWQNVSGTFPGARWAVRSSAVAEDLVGASFAGIFETVLNVDSLDSLCAAVRTCWSAFEAERAAVYRQGQNLETIGGIALVLQRMLEPRVSGVLLTSNPLRSFAAEIAIDASWGLGEAIVSGRTDPDHLVIARSDGEIREVLIGSKLIEIVWDGATVEREVDAERRSMRCLTDDDVATLHELAATVEASIGPRRDVEWAIEGTRLYALQDRPITGLPPEQPDNVWTRRWADEYLAEYSMPLSRGLLTRWIEVGFLQEMAKLQGRRDLVGVPALREHNGYSYFSGRYLVGMLAVFPPKSRRAALNDWFTPLWNKRVIAAPWQPRALVGMLLAPYRDRRRGSRGRNPQALERHCNTIDSTIVPRLWHDLSTLNNDDWLREYQKVDALGFEHFAVIRWGMAHHGPLLHSLLARLLQSWCDDRDGAWYQQMISGLPGTRTAEINRAVWDLAALALKDRQLTDSLRSQSSYEEVRDQHDVAPFWAAFDGFLDAYGHRSSSREISAPRWHEEPDVVLGLVRAQLRCDPFPVDPRATEKLAQARRLDAERKVDRLAGKGLFGRLRRAYLQRVRRTTQTYTVYRENQRFHLDYLTAYMRRLVLEQGRRLTEQHVLAEPFEVFFMTSDELWAAMSGEVDSDLTTHIEERRSHYLVHRHRLPASFLFDDVETEGEIAEGERTPGSHGDGLTGLGASRGTARGPTHVVLSLADLADVSPGEVLVANNIDPGWTSVFPLIAGLVTETGGVLSHGAILAREYGIPTVTGVKSAVDQLPTGTLVEVDGSVGTVLLTAEAVSDHAASPSV